MQRFKLLSVLIPLLVLCSCSKKQSDDDGELQAPGYAAVAVTNGGTVSGHVTLIGEHPVARPIETQKDQDVCGTSHPDPSALGEGMGIGGCVIAIEHITQGKAFAAGKLEVDQKACTFSPHVLIAPLGSSVVVLNSDDVLHNFHITKGATTLINEAQPEGSPAREVTMKSAGLLSVTCDVHPWMHSYVFVAENPYYALTDAQGGYSIENIPPGDYSLSLWRDNWNLEMVKDAQGRIESYKRGPDLVKQQQIHIEAGKPTTTDFTLP